MKKRKCIRLVAILLIALLIIPGNVASVFANQEAFGENSEPTAAAQEQVTTDTDDELLSVDGKDSDVLLEDEIGSFITVSFDSNGGESLQPILLEKGDSLHDLPIPFKENNTFVGWFTENGDSISTPLALNESVILYAKWEVQPLDLEMALQQSTAVSDPNSKKVTIVFDTMGGTPIDPLVVDKGFSLVDLPVPVKGDESFLGWTMKSGEPVNIPLEAAENITIYAVWDEQPISPDNPDNLLEFDDSPYGGEIDYNVWPLSEFGLLAPLMLRSSTRANDPPVIGTDHPTTPGEVMLFKEAKPIEGKVNTWEVKLRVEGKNKPTTSDIVLVIDTSGSMNDNGRMQAAKNAANGFIDALLTSEYTRIGIVSFESSVSVKSNLTNNPFELKNTVDNLSANGGTFTQAGVKQAEALLANSDADNKHIVLLSDGVPTYSYQLDNPDNYLIPYGENYQTSTLAPSSSYSYPTRVGRGTSMYWRYGTGGSWWNSYDKYYNHGNSAIAEAGFAGASGYNVFTVGLQTDSTGSSVLQAMAQGQGSFAEVQNVSDLTTVFAQIAGQIGAAVKDAAISDPMGLGFEIPLGEVTNITATQGTPVYENNTISWNPGTLTQPISEGSDINYAELTYTIEITDDILSQTPDANGEYPTNGDAQISYADAYGNLQTAAFPIPKVNPVLYRVVKILQDKDGNEITADRNFSIQVKGPGNDGDNTIREFTLNTSSQNSTKLLTDLRYASTYTFEETGDLSDYDTTYYINGGETSDLSFHIDDNNTEDVEVKVINKEKPGTLVITKVLDQSVIPSPAKSPSTRGETNPVSFSFTVTGPDGYSQNFTLPDNGSWTQTLEGLAKGSYIVTETTTGYTTTMQVNDDAPIAANTVNVNIDIGHLSQSVTITNKQSENMSVTATKTWEGGPAEKPDIRFQLIRVNDDNTETKVGDPRQVVNNFVTWNQADEGLAELLLRYDENGQEYSYKVQEVDAAGNDFTPENYTKVETGLNVTNTYSKKASVQVTKAWADANNQDGVRPESVTIKLLANGEDTGKTLVLTATNNWTGTFSDLDEYANGELISYTVEEVAIGNGYTTVVTGTAGDGYTVTNSRTPETLTVSGKKTWDDNNNQDGMRPESITIRLLKNGVEIDSKTVTEADGWAWSFADLAKYEDGELITYTITEDAVADYSSEVSGYNVTNTHTPGKTSVQVTKAWADANNQDGVRPESVTIKLLANGEDTGKTLVLTATNNWTGTFSDLDEYANGELISYTVEEVAIGNGYTTVVTGTAGDGYTVTNSRTPETLTVSGKKTWDDNNNQDGMRPESITIRLLKNGVEIDSKTVTEADGWAWSFADLAKYEDGELITYTITEDAVADYSSEVSGYNVTNTHTPGKTSVQVTKAWADANNQDGVRPESVTIKLLANGEDTGKTLVLTATNNWTGTFSDLDEYANGELISYTVEEVAIGNGYTTVVTGTAGDGYTVTNSRTPETLTVSGKKTWDDNNNQDGMRPESITIRLLKNGVEIDSKTVTEADGWAWSFADLAKYEDGELITYTITEDAVADYSSEVSGYNVTNTHTPGKTSVQVTKAWADANNQDGVRPESVTIKLLANGEDTGKTLVLTATNNWTGTFSDLDEYANGELISYTVEEVAIGNGYTTVVTGTAGDGYTVTNSRTPETLTVSGKKTWDDNNNQDGMRPESITIRLLKNGVEIDSKTVTEADGWAWSFADLAKYEDGELITYTITEDAVADYSSEVSGYNVTNTHTPGKTSVQVTKAWADANNQDGVRPESVTIKLLANGEDTGKTLVLTATNNWTGTFSDLDEYANGELISYTVEEVAIGNGYTTVVTGTAGDGYTVTNSRTPETLTVSGKKTWDDNNNQDGMRPESITIRLLKNGVEIDSKTVTEADGWAWSFADLAKYEDGELITYTITEDAVADYSSEVSGYNVTNTHTPGKTSVQVTKAWADANNQDGVRPESVTIKLLANGEDTGKTLVLTATNNWTGTFSDLDEYANGELISYTVEEVAIGNGYVTVISGDQRTGYKVTNVRTPNPPDHPSTPTEPSEPKTPTTLPRTGESGSIYGWLGMFLLSLGLFLIMIKREFQLRKKHD